MFKCSRLHSPAPSILSHVGTLLTHLYKYNLAQISTLNETVSLLQRLLVCVYMVLLFFEDHWLFHVGWHC